MGRRDPQHSNRSAQQRTVLAQMAARLMAEHGITDFRVAKSKAAERLGLSQHGALPSNLEIEAALAEHNRIFAAESQDNLLLSLRETALGLMQLLDTFTPCLVGPVLSGHVTRHTVINLHLFSESPEWVGQWLDQRQIRHQWTLRRCRISRDQNREYPGLSLRQNGWEAEAIVFPENRVGHAPLSPVDGRPMRRARLQEVERLATGQRLVSAT